MPVYSYLIMTSFALLILTFISMVFNSVLEKRFRLIIILHYIFIVLAGILYFTATILILLNDQLIQKFKNEVVIFAFLLVITYLTGYLGKHKQQRLIHYLMSFILIIAVIVFHFKWSGLL